MALGQMTDFIEIVSTEKEQDDEGFTSEKEVTLASVRAYREGRHGTEAWANRAVFSTATDLFRFRAIPGVEVTTAMKIKCKGHIFGITSVEDVRGRGMYIEVLAEEVKPGG